jgi:hypothetical protein
MMNICSEPKAAMILLRKWAVSKNPNIKWDSVPLFRECDSKVVLSLTKWDSLFKEDRYDPKWYFLFYFI